MPLALPWLPGAIIAHLRADAAFVAVTPAGIGPRTPDPLRGPFARVQVPSVAALDGHGVTFAPLVQVSGWAPPSNTTDPEGQAWTIAAEAARVLGAVRAGSWRNVTYSLRLVDGPQPHAPDTARGAAVPLHGAFVRAELRLQVH
ncbi:hypothetical protein KCV87_32180 [Actinosynnema pretiosum subsp. pretiosum]|uniref:DUF3168 domain-containing protein n=1 Tax=Actinosynnema pretiosum subsp. pretiosum TaxID=103721 RepID=A0AA45R3K9_9PSEU|nr:hypothetical protein APASM_4703 [Actinosynnema pretiosum subsp. pretiosum]QUF03962.1 hypothetical protein KCV87_32180 [Actinosynnema pretiosum subsp. pretiosum]